MAAQNNKFSEQHYSLTTAMCLIIGVCIGSGIYFKADNILIATGGSVALGVVMFIIASIVIIFGGLSLSVFASRDTSSGGTSSYATTYLPKPLARIYNWQFAYLYLPLISAVLSWVVGVYTCLCFGLENTLVQQVSIGLIFLTFCVAWNMLWPKLAGYFQNITTVIKILPLIVVGILGIVFARPDHLAVASSSNTLETSTNWLLVAAPIAFSFDGWSAATSIAAELKDAKRNMPRALIISPLIILALYLAYFIGITGILGADQVMEAGDASLSLVFVKLAGPSFAQVPNVIALISIMGGANGIILSNMRQPYALATRGEIPHAQRLSRVSSRLHFPLQSALYAYGLSLLWMFVHGISLEFNLIPNGDISELSVATNMIILCLLFGRVYGFYKAGELGIFRGLIAPSCAIIGSLFVGISALADVSRLPFLALFVLVLIGLGLWAYTKARATKQRI